jgi:hypothetical protein
VDAPEILKSFLFNSMETMKFFKFFFVNDEDVKVNYAEVFEDCKTDSDRGKLIMAMISYIKTGVEPTLPEKLKKDWRYIRSGLNASKKGFDNRMNGQKSKQVSDENEIEMNQVSDENGMKMKQKSNSTPIDYQQVNPFLMPSTSLSPSPTDRLDREERKDRTDRVDNNYLTLSNLIEPTVIDYDKWLDTILKPDSMVATTRNINTWITQNYNTWLGVTKHYRDVEMSKRKVIEYYNYYQYK